MWLIADSTYFQITTGILHHYIPFAPFQTAPSHAPALIIYNLCLMLHLRFEWELGNVGALFVCLLIEHFPLGWIIHSMMTRCSRAKNDAPQTPVYSDSFKWIPTPHLLHTHTTTHTQWYYRHSRHREHGLLWIKGLWYPTDKKIWLNYYFE